MLRHPRPRTQQLAFSHSHTLDPRDPQHEPSGLTISQRADTVVFYSIGTNWFIFKEVPIDCALYMHHRVGDQFEAQVGQTHNSNVALGGN